MKKQSKLQAGFTLIELVMVIVILGILAAVAIPKFIDLKSEAQVAALAGVVGSIESASAVNYAGRSANATKGVATATLTCAAVVPLILQSLPAGYVITGSVGAVGATGACTVTQTGGGVGTANVIGI